MGFSTLRELILKRPATQLQLLLELSTHEKEQVRVQAIHSAKKLHTRPELAEEIEVRSCQQNVGWVSFLYMSKAKKHPMKKCFHIHLRGENLIGAGLLVMMKGFKDRRFEF